MATFTQRATAIADALVNGTANADQRARLAAAFTNGQPNAALAAELFIRELRAYVLARVEQYESMAAVTAAKNATAADVAADFTEAP